MFCCQNQKQQICLTAELFSGFLRVKLCSFRKQISWIGKRSTTYPEIGDTNFKGEL